MSNNSAAAISSIGIGGSIREHHWTWKDQPITGIYEILGDGKPILLLPALSSVSSRTESPQQRV